MLNLSVWYFVHLFTDLFFTGLITNVLRILDCGWVINEQILWTTVDGSSIV